MLKLNNMPLAQPLETLRKELEAQLVDDLAAALKSLQTLLPEKSEKYGLVIVLLGRLNDANEARIRDTLADDDLQRNYNRIRADLFDLVQGLQEADFDPALRVVQSPPDSALGIYIDCGQQDDFKFYPMNLSFRDSLEKAGLNYVFKSFQGGHSNKICERMGSAFED
jgi:hypothetical protein